MPAAHPAPTLSTAVSVGPVAPSVEAAREAAKEAPRREVSSASAGPVAPSRAPAVDAQDLRRAVGIDIGGRYARVALLELGKVDLLKIDGHPATTVVAAPPPATTLELDPAEERVATGGWYRLDESYTLHYRPAGHEDAFLTAWLDGTVNNPAPTAQGIFTQLAAPTAPGACMKCHTVDRTAGATVVNWRAARPAAGVRPFTTFKHTAHFSLMGTQGCSTCHTLATGADYARSFGANRDPALFQSNFAPLRKDVCATCHQPAKAGESCQLCHNYHTGEMVPLRLPAAEFSKPRLPR